MADESPETADRNLLVAARVLAHLGLVQGHGHLSRRAERANAMISTPRGAPSLTTLDELVDTDLDRWEEQADRLPVEAIMHVTIYRRHPGVGAIVRVHGPVIDAIGTRMHEVPIVHGRGSHLGDSPTVLRDPAPISTAPLAETVAGLLEGSRAVVLRGNGAVAVGASIQDATANASYLLETAQIHLTGSGLGPALPLTPDERGSRKGGMRGDSSQRTWDFLVSQLADG